MPLQIGHAARGVGDFSGGQVGVHGVNRKVPPERVVRQARAKRDLARAVLAAVFGVRFPPEGRMLHANAVRMQLHRAHLRRFGNDDNAHAAPRKQRFRLRRGQPRADVDIRRLQPQ
ncbi:hypothetical protein SDC9_68625 [bioreactor metagenome]|uniref:Uncharacterized protein n=1 Tax=bioreactor metagenome TaxID=1076179 RepID=A0A644Y7S1_9ZZZZ